MLGHFGYLNSLDQHTPIVEQMRRELLAVTRGVGLTPETDTIPIDEGIKKELPDPKIR